MCSPPQVKSQKGALFSGTVHSIPKHPVPPLGHTPKTVPRWLCFLGPRRKGHTNASCFLFLRILQGLGSLPEVTLIWPISGITHRRKAHFHYRTPDITQPLNILISELIKATFSLLLLSIKFAQEQNRFEFRCSFCPQYLDLCHHGGGL